MTVARHPAELELLALVEGELSRGTARAVEEHLGACAACRSAVAAQRAVRAVLRGAPAVPPLAPQELQALVRSLPAHPRPTGLAAAPTAAAGAQAGPSAQAAPAAGGAPAAKAAPPASATPSAKAASPDTVRGASGTAHAAIGPGALLGAVAGSPARVVALLRARGIATTTRDGQVLVREADGPRARAALAALPSGPVRVLVR